MIIATITENISVDTLFLKNLPKETRALLNGIYSFSGQLGILIYSIVSGYIFDKIGPKSPFILIGILDLVFASMITICSVKGMFKN
mmetsp:Transcript_8687/g.14736  ORF Transcript_8687/g.14736 Transcript_8687/m.14736 type:complete len:86 (-) Transcript_8687:36-293(-)